MEFKDFVNALKKRVVLIPLGTIAAIATIIGVIHQFQPKDREFENLISEYVNASNHLDQYEVNDSLSSDSLIIRLESIQDDIELYIKSISKINPNLTGRVNSENRMTIAKQNLLIIMDGISIGQRCRNNLSTLILTADSTMKTNIEKYISFQKLEDAYLKEETFNKNLNKKEVEISRYAASGNQKMITEVLEQIISSKELTESLSENKQLYVDLYDSINLLKRKYQRQ